MEYLFQFTAIESILNFLEESNQGVRELEIMISTGLYGTLEYDYDKNGNRTAFNDGVDDHLYDYVTNTHRLNSITNGSTQSFTYDANGNTTHNGTHEFVYGEHNRLKEVTLGALP